MEPVLPGKLDVRKRAVINARRSWEPQGSHCKVSFIPLPSITPASSNPGAATQVGKLSYSPATDSAWPLVSRNHSSVVVDDKDLISGQASADAF